MPLPGKSNKPLVRRVVVERVPTANFGRSDYIEAVSRILSWGSASKIIIEAGCPIYVERTASEKEDAVTERLMDPLLAIRSSELIELEDAPPKSILMALARIGESGNCPRFVLVNVDSGFIDLFSRYGLLSTVEDRVLLLGFLEVVSNDELDPHIAYFGATQSMLSPLFDVVFAVKINLQ